MKNFLLFIISIILMLTPLSDALTIKIVITKNTKVQNIKRPVVKKSIKCTSQPIKISKMTKKVKRFKVGKYNFKITKPIIVYQRK